MKIATSFLTLLMLASVALPRVTGAGPRCPAAPEPWMYFIPPEKPKKPETADEWKKFHRGTA